MLIGLQFLPTLERLGHATADLLEGEDVELVERLILVVLVVSQPEYKILVGFGDRQSAEHPVPDGQDQAEILVQILSGGAVVQLMVVRANQNRAVLSTSRAPYPAIPIILGGRPSLL